MNAEKMPMTARQSEIEILGWSALGVDYRDLISTELLDPSGRLRATCGVGYFGSRLCTQILADCDRNPSWMPLL